ncbi:MAG: hypothetical protein M1835_005300 [Candelina submexicana]|nr:MAG: hypothetical protein M1835_005300 [Candelina submexicana]
MPCISHLPKTFSLASIHPPPAQARYWIPIWTIAVLASSLNAIYIIPYCLSLIRTRVSPTRSSLLSRLHLFLALVASVLLWLPSIFSSGLGAWAAYDWSVKDDSVVLKGLAAGMVVITAVNTGYAFAAMWNLMQALGTCKEVGRLNSERLESGVIVGQYRDEKGEKEVDVV